MNPIIDLHQDLMLYISQPELYTDRGQTSFEKIQNNNIKVTVVSAFVVPADGNYTSECMNDLIEKTLKDYVMYCDKNPSFRIIKNKDDLNTIMSTEGLYGLILHIEGLNTFDEITGWDTLERWYELGLRSIGPLWNINNPFGGGTLDPSLGLSELGKKLITWCEQKGMLFDFAHMNEKTFWDASQVVSRPIFVSHGNAHALCKNVRNYTDEQIKAIGESGGVIGVFFSKKFVSADKKPTIDDVLKHVNHIVSLVGENAVAIGSDFGGITSGFAKDLESLDDLKNLITSLPNDIQSNISYKNALRIIKAHLV
ncbi:MAG: membrane dipeptidase [Candidatus Zambryskibacteria bacterium]|nr:membrane dipeptidase [Candidatus Zambryskibacteria bacterium]